MIRRAGVTGEVALTDTDQLYDLRTVAGRLACSVKTLKRAIDLGLIQHVRIGRVYRVSEPEVRRLIRDGLPQL